MIQLGITFLSGILLTVCIGWAKPLSQLIYEDLQNKPCVPASSREIESLTCQLKSSGLSSKDYDTMSEQIVFTELAKEESSRLNCLENETQRILKSPDIKEAALKKTCQSMRLLKDSLDNEDFLKREIKSYETINDRMLRGISDSEFKKNKEVIDRLKKLLVLYQEQIQIIRENDVVLSSPRVFSFVVDSFKPFLVFSGKATAEVCASLTTKIDNFLKADVADHQQSKKYIDKKLRSGSDWINDSSFKRQLWNSAGHSNLDSQLTQVKGDIDFKKSTLCRMEARYGEGAHHLERLTTIGSLALGPGFSVMRNVAIASYAHQAKVAYNIARSSMVVELATGTGMVGSSIIEGCKGKLKSVSAKRSCEAISDSEFKSLFFDKQGGDACLIASATGVVFGGILAVGGASGLLSFSQRNGLREELSSRLSATQKALEQTKGELVTASQSALITSATGRSIAPINFKKIRNPKEIFDDFNQALQSGEWEKISWKTLQGNGLMRNKPYDLGEDGRTVLQATTENQQTLRLNILHDVPDTKMVMTTTELNLARNGLGKPIAPPEVTLLSNGHYEINFSEPGQIPTVAVGTVHKIDKGGTLKHSMNLSFPSGNSYRPSVIESEIQSIDGLQLPKVVLADSRLKGIDLSQHQITGRVEKNGANGVEYALQVHPIFDGATPVINRSGQRVSLNIRSSITVPAAYGSVRQVQAKPDLTGFIVETDQGKVLNYDLKSAQFVERKNSKSDPMTGRTFEAISFDGMKRDAPNNSTGGLEFELTSKTQAVVPPPSATAFDKKTNRIDNFR